MIECKVVLCKFIVFSYFFVFVHCRVVLFVCEWEVWGWGRGGSVWSEGCGVVGRSGGGYRRGSRCVLILGLACSCWRGKHGSGLLQFSS